jgi:leucyl aminopeptidase
VANASDLISLPTQVSAPAFELDEAPLRPREAGTVVAVPVLAAAGEDDDPTLGPGAAALEETLGVDLLALLDHHEVTGKVGEVVSHPVLGHDQFHSVLCVGVGRGAPTDLHRAGAEVARRVKGRQLLVTTLSAIADDDGLGALVEGLTLGSFEFHWRSQGARAQPVRRVVLAAPADRQPLLDKAVAIASASWRARVLATTPSNLKTPAWLAAQATELALEAGLKVKVWDERQLEADGFGGISAVGNAAAAAPRLIRLDYTPRKAVGHLVLVGKGITFDSGGLSIKPGELMVNMKRDMTGGGVVLATMAALKAVGCPVRVTGLVAAAENAIGGNALRPGDVITHFGGLTTEVTNTDAEGRLVLADALAYADAELDPDVVVDVATLTGAAKVLLGLKTGAVFATDDTLAGRLIDSGAQGGEPLWRLPLLDDYEERLSSRVADLDNSGSSSIGGVITAALFLQRFTGGRPWAHLDIASVGDALEEDGIYTKGPTGFGARALLRWLGQDDPLKGIR